MAGFKIVGKTVYREEGSSLTKVGVFDDPELAVAQLKKDGSTTQKPRSRKKTA